MPDMRKPTEAVAAAATEMFPYEALDGSTQNPDVIYDDVINC